MSATNRFNKIRRESCTLNRTTSAIIEMAKFKVLKYHDFALNKLIIYPLITHYILLNLILFLSSSIVFVYQITSKFDEAIRACFLIFGTCQAIGMFYSYGRNLSEIHAVHSKLNGIIRKIAEGEF